MCFVLLGCTWYPEVIVAVAMGFLRTGDGLNHRQGATFAPVMLNCTAYWAHMTHHMTRAGWLGPSCLAALHTVGNPL